MHYKSAKEIWDKIVTSYEGDEQVKRAKLQTLRIQYETLKMNNDESLANYFLRVDEVVNCMKILGEEIKEAIVVEKVLRSLSPKFESKVSAIEEKENLRIITMSQLHGILTSYEMRKGGPSDRREAAFKASGKGEYYEASHIPEEEEEESNFVKNLQRGSGRFRGKLPFKCFACGRVGHYATKCPYKDKGKEPARWNNKQGANKKSYYTHEDSDGLSNSDEDEREVWNIVETGYAFSSTTPTDADEKKKYETNAKAVSTLLGCISQTEFMKVMHYKSAKDIWDKIVTSYEGDEQVKRAKLQTLRIQYETLKMYNDESVVNHFLRVDEVVNCMKNLGEEIKEAIVVEKVLRSLSPKFESKVSAIEEKENLRILTMS
eukprot:PITA_03723